MSKWSTRLRGFIGSAVCVMLIVSALSFPVLAQKTHITMAAWVWGSRFEELIAEFEELHPDIEVELIITPSLANYRQRIPTMFAGGVAPDVAMVHSSDFVGWIDMYQPLDKFVEASGVDLDEYFPVAINAWRWKPGALTVGEGDLYAMPLTYQTVNMFMYNINLFDEAGLAYPDESWTWETEVEAARRLTHDVDGDGVADRIGIHGLGSLDDLWARTWQAGGEWMALDYSESLMDRPAGIEALEFIVNRLQMGIIREISGGFLSGNAGMHFGGQWLVGTNRYHENADFEWGVALHPKHPRTGLRTIGARPDGIGIMAGTEHPEAAWELVKFLSSPEILGRRAAEEQIAVPHIDAAWENLYGPDAAAYMKMPRGWELMPQALFDVHPTYYLGPDIGRIRSTSGNYLIKARNGELAPSVAAVQMAEAVNAILAGLKE